MSAARPTGTTVATALPRARTALASGAGHDSAVFTEFGVPSAMIFIRNAHGSHNPDEAMEMEDFAAATRLLASFLGEGASR